MHDDGDTSEPGGWDRTDPDFWSGREYLRGATFRRKPVEADEYNDHEHCDRCFATLDPGDVGYETTASSGHPDGGHYCCVRSASTLA